MTQSRSSSQETVNKTEQETVNTRTADLEPYSLDAEERSSKPRVLPTRMGQPDSHSDSPIAVPQISGHCLTRRTSLVEHSRVLPSPLTWQHIFNRTGKPGGDGLWPWSWIALESSSDCTVLRVLGLAFIRAFGSRILPVIPDTSGDIARARRDVS